LEAKERRLVLPLFLFCMRWLEWNSGSAFDPISDLGAVKMSFFYFDKETVEGQRQGIFSSVLACIVALFALHILVFTLVDVCNVVFNLSLVYC